MTDKKELNIEELEKISGGDNFPSYGKYNCRIIKFLENGQRTGKIIYTKKRYTSAATIEDVKSAINEIIRNEHDVYKAKYRLYYNDSPQAQQGEIVRS